MRSEKTRSQFLRQTPTSPSRANMASPSNHSNSRCCTRVPCNIPATLTSLDPCHTLSDTCLIILVSPQGCAARFQYPLKVGTSVRLLGLPAISSATAQVVNCISIGGERLLGLALDEPADIWGIPSTPDDWCF
jgi:hypothetical protein